MSSPIPDSGVSVDCGGNDASAWREGVSWSNLDWLVKVCTSRVYVRYLVSLDVCALSNAWHEERWLGRAGLEVVV